MLGHSFPEKNIFSIIAKHRGVNSVFQLDISPLILFVSLPAKNANKIFVFVLLLRVLIFIWFRLFDISHICILRSDFIIRMRYLHSQHDVATADKNGPLQKRWKHDLYLYGNGRKSTKILYEDEDTLVWSGIGSSYCIIFFCNNNKTHNQNARLVFSLYIVRRETTEEQEQQQQQHSHTHMNTHTHTHTHITHIHSPYIGKDAECGL